VRWPNHFLKSNKVEEDIKMSSSHLHQQNTRYEILILFTEITYREEKTGKLKTRSLGAGQRWTSDASLFKSSCLTRGTARRLVRERQGALITEMPSILQTGVVLAVHQQLGGKQGSSTHSSVSHAMHGNILLPSITVTDIFYSTSKTISVKKAEAQKQNLNY
jgi:hypothetical protein